MADPQPSQLEVVVSGGDVYPVNRRAARKQLRRRETLTGNPLSMDVVYTQRIVLLQENKGEEFKKRIIDYADKMLNDQKFGVVFFKARVFSTKSVECEDSSSDQDPDVDDQRGVGYVLHFHVFAEEYLTEKKMKTIKDEFLPKVLVASDGKPLAELASTELTVHEDTNVRKPVYVVPQEDTDSPRQIGGLEPRNCLHKCLNYWLIVPRVQIDFFNLIYQLYAFDIHHQGCFIKLAHFMTIPLNSILFFMFLAQFKLPGSYIEDTSVRLGPFFFPTNWSCLPLGILVLLYITVGIIHKFKVWGFTTAVVIAMLWGAGNLFYEEVRLPTDVNATGVYKEHWLNPVYLPYNPLIWTYIVSLCQVVSHAFQSKVPPYITGTTHWESTHTHLWRYNGPRRCCYKALSIFLCFPILSVAVSYISWPHLIGTQVLYILSGIGYKHGYFTKFKLIAEKANLTGNPRCAYFPSSANTLMNPQHPYKKRRKDRKMEEHRVAGGSKVGSNV